METLASIIGNAHAVVLSGNESVEIQSLSRSHGTFYKA